MNRPSDFVTLTRQAAAGLLASIDQLRALRQEWDAMGYSGTLGESDAFAGANADLDEAKIAAVIGTTLDAVNGLLAQGHATNLYRLR